MVLTATELTAEVPPIRISRMRQEANSAVATVHRALSPIRTIAQDGIQRELILTNKRISAVVLVPIARKGENLLQRYDKNSRFSVMMRILYDTPSSYRIEAKASRGRTRFFNAP